MSYTNSIAFPNMIDVSKGTVQLAEDNASVVNRTRLLILTEPTELYNEPNFGVGLKRHLWKYNTENEKALIRDRIVAQLNLHEPCVVAENTAFADGLLFSGSADAAEDLNALKMTVSLQTTFGSNASIDLNSPDQLMDYAQQRYNELHT